MHAITIRRSSALLAAALIVAGCDKVSVKSMPTDALANADAMEVYAIDPASRGTGGFFGYAVLGHAPVTDPAERARIAGAMRQAAIEREGIVAACGFLPRHGIRVVHGAVTTDYIICFHCGDVAWTGGPMFPVSDGPRSLLDAALARANVPIAP